MNARKMSDAISSSHNFMPELAYKMTHDKMKFTDFNMFSCKRCVGEQKNEYNL